MQTIMRVKRLSGYVLVPGALPLMGGSHKPELSPRDIPPA